MRSFLFPVSASGFQSGLLVVSAGLAVALGGGKAVLWVAAAAAAFPLLFCRTVKEIVHCIISIDLSLYLNPGPFVLFPLPISVWGLLVRASQDSQTSLESES